MALRTRPALPLLGCCLLSALSFGLASAAQRVVLVEELTSQTCPPCASSNPSIDAMIESYGSQVAAVKWHVNWPAPGDDWFYVLNSDVIQNRVFTFYSAPEHGAPSLFVDGTPPNPLLNFDGQDAQHEIDLRLLIPSPLSLTGTAETRMATSTVDVAVDANVETPPTQTPGTMGTRIYAALVEKTVPTGVSYMASRTQGSRIVTVPSTRYLVKGSTISGTGVPGTARVSSVDSPTQFTMTLNATSTGSGNLNFASYNTETTHHDVFRVVNNNSTPTAIGDPIDLSTIGTQHFTFSLPFASDWDPEQFAVVVWVQNNGTGDANENTGQEVYQATTITPTIVNVAVSPTPTSVAMLGANRPNPFHGSTSIPFSIERARHVDLAIYDVSGRLVSRLVNGERAAGSYAVPWDGRDGFGRRLGNGVFYYRLKTDGADVTRRMVLMQ